MLQYFLTVTRSLSLVMPTKEFRPCFQKAVVDIIACFCFETRYISFQNGSLTVAVKFYTVKFFWALNPYVFSGTCGLPIFYLLFTLNVFLNSTDLAIMKVLFIKEI